MKYLRVYWGDIEQFGNKLHLSKLFVSIWNISVSIETLVYGILAYLCIFEVFQIVLYTLELHMYEIGDILYLCEVFGVILNDFALYWIIKALYGVIGQYWTWLS